MAIAGLVTGKLYYPIDYPIGKILLYLGITVLLVFASNYIKESVSSLPVSLIIHSLLIVGFLFFAYFKEKELVGAFRG